MMQTCWHLEDDCEMSKKPKESWKAGLKRNSKAAGIKGE